MSCPTVVNCLSTIGSLLVLLVLVMLLQWPAQDGGYAVPLAPGFIQLGVSIEPVAEVAAKEGSRLGDKMQFARRVGLDLYRFLESFATQATGDAILIPTSALDK
jgi:hypothetical protein